MAARAASAASVPVSAPASSSASALRPEPGRPAMSRTRARGPCGRRGCPGRRARCPPGDPSTPVRVRRIGVGRRRPLLGRGGPSPGRWYPPPDRSRATLHFAARDARRNSGRARFERSSAAGTITAERGGADPDIPRSDQLFFISYDWEAGAADGPSASKGRAGHGASAGRSEPTPSPARTAVSASTPTTRQLLCRSPRRPSGPARPAAPGLLHVGLLLRDRVPLALRLGEIPGQEDPHGLVAAAGRGVDVGQHPPVLGLDVRLLVQLALGGVQGSSRRGCRAVRPGSPRAGGVPGGGTGAAR